MAIEFLKLFAANGLFLLVTIGVMLQLTFGFSDQEW